MGSVTGSSASAAQGKNQEFDCTFSELAEIRASGDEDKLKARKSQCQSTEASAPVQEKPYSCTVAQGMKLHMQGGEEIERWDAYCNGVREASCGDAPSVPTEEWWQKMRPDERVSYLLQFTRWVSCTEEFICSLPRPKKPSGAVWNALPAKVQNDINESILLHDSYCAPDGRAGKVPPKPACEITCARPEELTTAEQQDEKARERYIEKLREWNGCMKLRAEKCPEAEGSAPEAKTAPDPFGFESTWSPGGAGKTKEEPPVVRLPETF